MNWIEIHSDTRDPVPAHLHPTDRELTRVVLGMVEAEELLMLWQPGG